MKKLFVLFVALFTLVVVAGCNGSELEFAVDGEFTAYEVGVHSNAPMVTMVTVTVEDGEIVGYYIDARQGKATQTAGADTPEDTLDDTYTFAWNEKTKKELGDDYNMVTYGGAIAEWYEQAALIEAYWLENGVDSVKVDKSTFIDNVAGVTIKDGGYTRLAKEAVLLAKAGKMQAVHCSGNSLYIATMNVNAKGDFSDLMLDTLQPSSSATTFAWNPYTKQDLGDNYGMKGVGGSYEFVNGKWEPSEDKATLEWYEQVELITDYVTENGWDGNLAAIDTRGGTIDGETLVDGLAGATIHTQDYYTVLGLLFDCLPE